MTPDAQEPWADIWLSWKRRPGKRIYASPCLCSGQFLTNEIRRGRRHRDDLRVEAAGGPAVASRNFRRLLGQEPPPIEQRLQSVDETLCELDAVAEALTHEPYVLRHPYTPACTIWMREPMLTRAVAEDALTWYLAEAYGVKTPKFHWQRPDFAIRSWG